MQNGTPTTKIQERQDHQDINQPDQYLPEKHSSSPTVIEPQPVAAPQPVTEPQAGRRADKTLRTKPLAMKVTPAFHKKLKIYAVEYEIDMVDIIEEAVAMWIAQLDGDKTRKH